MESRPLAGTRVCSPQNQQSQVLLVRLLKTNRAGKSSGFSFFFCKVSLFFDLLFRRACGGLTQLLISRRLKGKVLDSKSFLWDETEYLSAGGGGLHGDPGLGLRGFALAWANSGYQRNAAQTWRESRTDNTLEMFGLCVVTLETPVFLLLYQLCQALDVTQTHWGVCVCVCVWGGVQVSSFTRL